MYWSPFPIEVIGAGLSVLSTLIGSHNNPITWPIAVLAATCNGWLFSHQSELLMHTLREIIQLSMFFYGWYYWFIKRDKNHQHTLISSIPAVQIFSVLVLVTLICCCYALPKSQYALNALFGLHRTGSEHLYLANFSDSFTSLLHIYGLWLMTRRILESWFIWIIVDLVNIPFYLHLTTPLYAQAIKCMIYLCIATYGLYRWKTIYQQQDAKLIHSV